MFKTKCMVNELCYFHNSSEKKGNHSREGACRQDKTHVYFHKTLF